MKYAFIERSRRVWPISVQCRALEVSISGYHEHFIRLASAVQRRHPGDDAEYYRPPKLICIAGCNKQGVPKVFKVMVYECGM